MCLRSVLRTVDDLRARATAEAEEWQWGPVCGAEEQRGELQRHRDIVFWGGPVHPFLAQGCDQIDSSGLLDPFRSCGEQL